ncbi:MAG: TetR/AcrR family transcriptional regulator [Crocinitomicaceae bacterium]|nr:TetR/AcrR family transcriptional regulator [Crocinitomicaceae bacterium]MDG1659658.1 TetR/AcrR family transcriptional regulator [Crocinitomicaceae bacterium]
MKNLRVNIEISPELYLKNPDTSELGQSILSYSIELISEIGFEAFTFKKLGEVIKSPESSIYRYFKNKHSLLVYLTSWYWYWTEYRLVFATINIDEPKERLIRSLDILTKPVLIDNSFSYINEVKLSEIIFSESIKAYHTVEVDKENEKGCFKAYKGVVQRVGSIILEISPGFKYPHMLISTVIEGAHQQHYFSQHLPALTDTNKGGGAISEFYKELTLKALEL